MAGVSPFLKAAFVCLLLSAKVSSDDLLNSLRFTRDALLGFSRVVRSSTSDSEEAYSRSSKEEKQAEQGNSFRSSNKKLQIENEIEKATENAKAMESRRPRPRTRDLVRLFTKAVNSKSYSYARDILGKLVYQVQVMTTRSSKRRKRSPKNAGARFLKRLLENIGSEKIDSFMAVNGSVSLMFVVDDTGSMSDEIEQVKRIAITVVNYRRKAPVEFILSPFNDPMTDAAPIVIRDDGSAGEFVQAINNLTADKGGDCPEYTFEGMKNAFEQAGDIYKSSMYVFTDAGPKEAEKYMELILDIATSNDVKINFFSTGSCEHGLHPDFLKLSKMTSGKALLFRNATEMAKLGNVMADTLKGTSIIGSGSSLSGRRKRSSERESRYRFPVDDSMEAMIIYVTTTRETNGRGIALKNPAGAIVTAEKLPLSIISVYQIAKPAKGNWTLEILEEETGEYEFYVESSSEINIDFKVYFMFPLGHGRWKVEAPLSDPVAGKSNKMVLRLFARERIVNTSSLQLHIVTESGDFIRNFSLLSQDEHYVIIFTPPATPFKLKLIGTTQQGHRFEREYHRIIKPTTAVLRGKYASNDFTLRLNSASFLQFQICNFGASELFEIVARNDTMGYILHPSAASQRPKYVGRNRCITIYLRARATRPADVHKMDTVVLKAKGTSSGVEISGNMRLLVDDRKG